MVDPIVRAISTLIRMRGGEATMVVKTAGVYDPATSTVATAEASYTVQAIVFEAKESIAPNSLIRAGDKQMFVKADDSFPAPDAATSTILQGGKTYKVIWSKALNPSGTKALMYELFLRG